MFVVTISHLCKHSVTFSWHRWPTARW